MKYFRVKNWDRHQHYKDRCPPWIKLHRELLSSRTWVMLDDDKKALAIACMLIAAATDNRIPADAEYVQRLAYLRKTPNFDPLVETDFIEFIDETGSVIAADSKVEQTLANRTTETEKKEKEEKSRAEKTRASALVVPEGLDLKAWDRFETYRREIRKPIKPGSVQAAQQKLAGFGADQAAVVEESIAQGWTGLFPLKCEPGSKPKLTWRPPPDDEEQPHAQ